MNALLSAVTRFLTQITRNALGMAGAAVTSVSAILFFTLFALELAGFHAGPYLGILAFLVIPAFFLLGLILVPLGLWRERVRQRRATAAGAGAAAGALPVWDLNLDQVRRNLLVFVALTAVNLVILAVATFKGVEVMDSTTFCGQACHSVMHPEYTTYQRSAHARVACVACHIGPGANWFVKSKLSGSWQVVSVAFDLYPRPIPVPVHSLRPARETCEQCHWPQKFVGDRLKVNTHYQEDEANTELKTVLIVKVGGRQGAGSHGIHWHVDPDHVVRYRSDEKRQTIYEVERVTKDGVRKTWTSPAADTPEGKQAGAWRTMDCVDCHNRPTHIYREPQRELDAAIFEKRIDATLPFVRREGLAVLLRDYPSEQVARNGIARTIAEFYAKNYPGIAARNAASVAAAGKALGDIWSWNVFPRMNVRWGTYQNHIGHTAEMSTEVGCFRCHDEQHQSPEGGTISQDCGTCHTVLAQEVEDPEILKTLSP